METQEKTAYLRQIHQLLQQFDNPDVGDSDLPALQTHLDKIAARYQNDERIGNERYLMYQAQGMLHYLNHEPQEAAQWIEESVNVKGSSYPFAEEMLNYLHVLKQPVVTPHNSALRSVASILGALVGIGVGRAYPVVGVFFFLPAFIGLLYGTWYANREHINEGWVKFLFWSNTFTWIIPPLGILTSTASFSINSRNNGPDRSKYMTLATVGISLGILNGILGVILAAHR